MDQPHSKNKSKVKFMCSYGGKILPKAYYNNNLAYIGGDTRILAVDRNVKLSAFRALLYSFCKTDFHLTYQLPGDDLDTLISVINDEDLENMMFEYDHASTKPGWLRLLLFPITNSEPLCSASVEVYSPPAKSPDSAPAPFIPAKSPSLELKDCQHIQELGVLPVDKTKRVRQRRINEVEGSNIVPNTEYRLQNIPETPAPPPLHDQARPHSIPVFVPESHVASGGYALGAQSLAHFARPVPVTVSVVEGNVTSNGYSAATEIKEPVRFIRAPSGMFQTTGLQAMARPVGQAYCTISRMVPPAQVYNATSGEAYSGYRNSAIGWGGER